MQIGQVVLRRYQVTELLRKKEHCLLGRGIDLHAGRPVVLKQLLGDPQDPTYHGRWITFRKEGVLRIPHPLVVNPLAVDCEHEAWFLIRPFIEGNDLRHFINRQKGMLPIPVMTSIMLQLAETLSAIHKQHIVHGDIKAGNIVITDAGQAYLIDFELHRDVRWITPRDSLCVAGNIFGMAPEQLNGGSRGDSRSDLYAAGVTLYCMLTPRSLWSPVAARGQQGSEPLRGPGKCWTQQGGNKMETLWQQTPSGETRPFHPDYLLWREQNQVFESVAAYTRQGVTLEQARATLAVVANRLQQMDSKGNPRWTIGVDRLLHKEVKGGRQLLLLLLGAASLVLLIAVGNVANLSLARATTHQRELAIRVALGATRQRVWRQILTESLLLGVCAGVLGLMTTFLTIKGLVHLCPANVPRLEKTGVDLSVLIFALGHRHRRGVAADPYSLQLPVRRDFRGPGGIRRHIDASRRGGTARQFSSSSTGRANRPGRSAAIRIGEECRGDAELTGIRPDCLETYWAMNTADSGGPGTRDQGGSRTAGNASGVLELAQHLSEQCATFTSSQLRNAEGGAAQPAAATKNAC